MTKHVDCNIFAIMTTIIYGIVIIDFIVVIIMIIVQLNSIHFQSSKVIHIMH